MPLSHMQGAPTALVHLLCRFLVPVWLLLFTMISILTSYNQYMVTTGMFVNHPLNMTDGPPGQSQRLQDVCIGFGHYWMSQAGDQIDGQVIPYLEKPNANLNGMYRSFATVKSSFSMLLLPIPFALCFCLVGVAVATFFRTCSFHTSFGDIKYLQVTHQIRRSKCWVGIVIVMQCLFPLAVFFLVGVLTLDPSRDNFEFFDRLYNFMGVFTLPFGTCFAAVHALAATDPTTPEWYKYLDNPDVAEACDDIVFSRGFAGMAEGNPAFMHKVTRALLWSVAIGPSEGGALAALLEFPPQEHFEETRKALIKLQQLEAWEKHADSSSSDKAAAAGGLGEALIKNEVVLDDKEVAAFIGVSGVV